VDNPRRFTGRQITVLALAVCVTVIAAPVVALAAAASFTSSSASTPAVSGKNSSSGSGAKAVFGDASASHGTTYGVYGRAASSAGYGVYSAGRLGSAGKLVCAHCVTGGDVDAASLPTVPNASKLGGHAASYYARIIPLSTVLPLDDADHLVAAAGGLNVFGECGSHFVNISVRADSAADSGTVNYFYVSGTAAQSGGTPLDTSRVQIATSFSATQTEGTITYRNAGTQRIVTVDFHLFGDGCELFGEVTTAA